MKTLEEVKKYKFQAMDNRDVIRLMQFIPEDVIRLMQFIPEAELKDFDIVLKDEYVGKHKHIEFSRENILKQLEKDVEFGFQKALDRRGISSSIMAEVVQMWNWILEEGLEDFDEYPMYGLPIFKATALKYGFENPIGDDSGSEEKYGE